MIHLSRRVPTARRAGAIGLAVLVSGVLAGSAQAQDLPYHVKFDTAVDTAVHAQATARAIVGFTDPVARETGRQTALAAGATVGRDLDALTGLTVTGSGSLFDALASTAGVTHISLDARLSASDAHEEGSRIAREMFGRSGHGVTVAVIDSGVEPVADLETSRILAFVDFVNGRTTPYDDFGHGTHVAGIIAGNGAASNLLTPPYTGVAPATNLVVLKVLDANGTGRTSDVAAALQWVLANAATYNIRIVNLSLGHPVLEPAATDPLVTLVEQASRRGIVVVAAAGNRGQDPVTGAPVYGGIASPANAPSAITSAPSTPTAPRSAATTRSPRTVRGGRRALISSRNPTLWHRAAGSSRSPPQAVTSIQRIRRSRFRPRARYRPRTSASAERAWRRRRSRARPP